MLAAIFLVLSLVGSLLAHLQIESKGVMQVYAITLSAASITAVAFMAYRSKKALLSCKAMVLLAPIWFLYLEAIFKNGDCWLLPAYAPIGALGYSAFFLALFLIAYRVKPSPRILAFHDFAFSRSVPSVLFPLFGIALTAVIVFVVFARYGFDWEQVKQPYLAGRAGGSGLIKRGGTGGFEVFLQPLEFMATSIPTIAALVWVRFPSERPPSLALKLFVSACALFIVFIMFLGGSRGNLAVYLAGPACLWGLFGPRIGRLPFIAVSAAMFTLLIGVWQYQVKHRNHLLDRGGLMDMIESTSFDVTETHRDNNTYLFALNYMYRPDPFPFNGFYELYYLAVNPIPRAIWSGKPKGIQEDAETFKTASGPPSLGPILMGTASLSYSIVGDGYQMMHYFGVAIYAAIFGLLASAWDFIGQRRLLRSKLYFIVNASWLFWFLWGFRAGFAFVTGMYAVWGAYLFCFFIGRFGTRIRQDTKTCSSLANSTHTSAARFVTTPK